MAGETVPTVLNAFKEKLEAMTDEDFQPDNIFLQIKRQSKKKQVSRAKNLMPIRIAVSGEMHGPEFKMHLPARP